MKKFRHLIAMIAMVLAVSLFVASESCQLVSAIAGQNVIDSKLYLSEVKMFYGRTEAEAKSACEKEGFIFSSTNLNEGATNVIRNGDISTEPVAPMGIYMGYKTTEDKGDAITDLTLLDMKQTHFEKMDYKKFLDEHVSDFRNQAAEMKVLVSELDKKLRAGSPNAIMTYDALNLFYVDEIKSHDAEENLLGYYLIHNADITFFEKFIQRGNAMILSRIMDLLCNAVSDYNADGTTWVDRAKVSEVAYEYAHATSEAKNMYDQNCQDPAKKFVKAIRDFSETYTEAKQRKDAYGDTLGYAQLEGMTEENSMEKLSEAGTDCRFPEYMSALKTYALLDAIPYQRAGETVVNKASLLAENTQQTDADDAAQNTDENAESADENAQNVDENAQNTESITETYTSDKTLAQFIMELAADETLEDHLSTVYPIVNEMTPAQRIALHLGGLEVLVESLHQANDYPSHREEATNDAMQKLRDKGFKDGRIYTWYGVDTSLYNKKVVQTDASKEAKASGLDLTNSINDAARKQNNTLNQALEITDLVTGVFGGIMIIAELVVGSFWSLGTLCLSGVGTCFTAGLIGSGLAYLLLGAGLCALYILNIIATVVSFALLIYNILKWSGVLDDKRIDYSKIPDVVFDVRKKTTGAYTVRYDTVTSNASESVLRGNEWYPDFTLAQRGSARINIEGISAEHAELTAYQGNEDRWVAMYYSKAPAAGDPIEVTKGKDPFTTRNNYTVPEGYRPLTLIVGSKAADVNSVHVAEMVGSPLYVFFPGKTAVENVPETTKDNGRYITGVRLSYDDNQMDAINRLKNEDYEYIDVNLTPYKGFTYLGYKFGDASTAYTDLRLANSGAKQIVFGDAQYSLMGQDNKETTPDGLALYATTSKSAGSPIVSLSIEKKRLPLGSGMEPVCLFSGGNAVDVGAMYQDNICSSGKEDEYQYWTGRGFKSYDIMGLKYIHEGISEEDPSNGIYIYFKPKEQYLAKDKNGIPAPRYIAGFSYFLAGDKDTTDSRFGSNYDYMKTFARENGFELVEDGGEPIRVMSDEAGEMTMATTWRDVGGYPADTYNFDQVHTVYKNMVLGDSDGGVAHGFGFDQRQAIVYGRLTREKEELIYHTAMYFGVSYTYNPKRAITGVAGLATMYSESTSQIKYTGMATPAGSFLACNVSIQGCPIMSAGIAAGYYQYNTMLFPLYTNYTAKQKSNLSWMTNAETEVLTHYLLTSGPRDKISPLKEGDIVFNTQENPGQVAGYVPICDMRTPGDYDHPLNFALETTNVGSKYLYLYLARNAGGRASDATFTNEYTADNYVAGVFCGVGRNPETAIANLYSNAARLWPKIAGDFEDISATPMVTEFDEIIPIDLCSENPWYELKLNDTNVSSLKNGDWVRGNEMAYYRWEGHKPVEPLERQKNVDEYERDFKCAYIGVVRTKSDKTAAYGILKYYSDAKNASDTLNVGGTECTLAGGPIESPEGKYFLYYSNNSGTANYSASITSLEISKDIFINGYNTSYTVSEKDRLPSHELPKYGQLRMRTDEHMYIHMGYNRADLPYYEKLYIGVGKTKEEAYVDMVGTTNAYAAMDVNCNYNSYSDEWVVIGYRRTNEESYAIRDVFLYEGDDPPEKITAKPVYVKKTDKGKRVFKLSDTGVTYRLVKHNLKTGAEIVSLNKGNGGPGMYLYYTTESFYHGQTPETLVAPITNICFTYGDVSPRFATAEQQKKVFQRSYYANVDFETNMYDNPIWECVLGVTGSAENWKPTGEGATRMSLNGGIRPGLGGNSWNANDSRVYMYVNRAYTDDKGKETAYTPRKNGKLPEYGYYSPTSTFGILKQVG